MPVTLKPEPHDFYEKVQKNGEKFLEEHPDAKGKQLKDFWRNIIPDLHDAYSGVCAYTCHWISNDTGSKTVDHFKPKDKYPQDAYKWANYRLVCGMMNGRKSNREDILDPSTLQEGWFVLHFPSLQVFANKNLEQKDVKNVFKTIEV